MADLAALLAEVKAALHDGSGIPISNPEARWLGALVQAVEDQQRLREADAEVMEIQRTNFLEAQQEVAQLRADGQRLREIFLKARERLLDLEGRVGGANTHGHIEEIRLFLAAADDAGMETRGTYRCGICGKDTPHSHTATPGDAP